MSIDEEFPALHPFNQADDDNLQDLPLPTAAAPTADDAPPLVSLAGLTKTYHHFSSIGAPGGYNLLQQIEYGGGPTDVNASSRRINIYHPFSSKEDWQLARWLSDSGMPQTAIDAFLKLDRVSTSMPTHSFYTNHSGRLRRNLLHFPLLECYANASRVFPRPQYGFTL